MVFVFGVVRISHLMGEESLFVAMSIPDFTMKILLGTFRNQLFFKGIIILALNADLMKRILKRNSTSGFPSCDIYQSSIRMIGKHWIKNENMPRK
jgi:hypothetical protein